MCQNYGGNEDNGDSKNNENSPTARVVKFKALKAMKSPGDRKEDKVFMWISASGATHHMTSLQRNIRKL